MSVAGSERRTGNRWMMWAFWAAGVGLLLVELNAGMEYLEAGLQQNMGSMFGWAPAMAMVMIKAAEQTLWHWGTLSLVLRAVSLGVLGLLLVGLAVASNKQIVESREQEADKP
jgi:hypothetical protein